MFLNNPASTRSILTNNENAMASSHRSKSILGENGTKKASFNENAVKTPHRNKDAAATSKSGQKTTQRRRRALGDISNRKALGGGGGGGGKGGVVLKQSSSNNNNTQGSLKQPGNSKVLFPSSSTNNRTAQVKFSKTPSTKGTSNNKARLGGGGSGMKSVNSKPKQRASTEYDGVFGATTRWSTVDDIADDDHRLPFPEEEFNMADNLRDEMWERKTKEYEERDRLEDKRDEEQFMESIRMVREADEKDVEDYLAGGCRGISSSVKEDNDEWDLLDQKLPWEEEDGIYDPAEERRLSGSDPYSLWGDIDDF
ncbi:hypothetical protein ACHAXR_005715 [Thalassiosira sp. AJA248-18]